MFAQKKPAQNCMVRNHGLGQHKNLSLLDSSAIKSIPHLSNPQLCVDLRWRQWHALNLKSQGVVSSLSLSWSITDQLGDLGCLLNFIFTWIWIFSEWHRNMGMVRYRHFLQHPCETSGIWLHLLLGFYFNHFFLLIFSTLLSSLLLILWVLNYIFKN